MRSKRALITGITGQDGFYLANFLLKKEYEVFGIYRKSALDVHQKAPGLDPRINLIEGDLRDGATLISIIKKCQPDEIYNLAAQSFLATSWEEPEMASDVNGMGVLRLLEAIRIVNPKIKFYQASSREIFGIPKPVPETENTPMDTVNLYASAKAFGQLVIKNYRQKYGIFASSGIACNHESPRRGFQFVTRKITNSVARIKLGLQKKLYLGNLDPKRDWGFAGDYVEAMWMILQQEKPGDYIIATGKTHSVREFVEEAFKVVGMLITWEGEGLGEVGKCNGEVIIEIDEKFYREEKQELTPINIDKIKNDIGWCPKVNFKELIKMMVESDLIRNMNNGRENYSV
jgi:GDPmannose 4,6-dehydratase